MNSRKRILYIMAAVMIVLVVINPKTLAYFEDKFGGPERELMILRELELPHSSQINYGRLDQQLLQYWDGILYAYDMNGEQNWSIHLGVTNPTMITGSKEVLIVDSAKKQVIKVNNKGELVYSILLEEVIDDIKMCDEGYVLAYYKPQGGPLRNFETFDTQGKRIGEGIISEGEIINCAISGKADKVLLYTATVVNGDIEGSLMEFDLKGNLIGIEKMGEQIPLRIGFHEEERIFIFTNEVVHTTAKNEVNWKVQSEGIQHIAMEGKELLALYLKKEKSNSFIQGRPKNKLEIYDSTGKLLGESILEDHMNGLDILNGKSITYSDRTIYLWNERAEEEVSFKYSGDIEQVLLLPQGNIAVITKEKLSFYKIQ